MIKNEYLAPYKPLPWQIEPWHDKAPILLLTGSAGGGKSRLAGEKVHAFMKKYSGATCLMLRKAREYAGRSIVPFMDRTVISNDSQVTKKKIDGLFQYSNGSTLYWGGMKNDDQREGLRSIGPDGALDIVWFEEAHQFTEDDFNEMLARMRGQYAPWSQIILTTNPDAPTHWINKRLIVGGEASIYYSGAIDNTYNPPTYVEFLNRLTGILFERLVKGRWVQAEGAVYDEWDNAIHLIDPFEIPKDWRRLRVVDFGYTNPFVCQWWAQDPDGRVYMYREIYKTQTLVEDHTREIIRLSEGEMIEATISDHDAEDRATMAKYGVDTVPANKEISPGIQIVKQRLKVQEDSRPRLFIMRGALEAEDQRLVDAKRPTCTADEFPGYVWTKAADGKPVKEIPVKENDHGVDAARYFAVYVDDPIWLTT